MGQPAHSDRSVIERTSAVGTALQKRAGRGVALEPTPLGASDVFGAAESVHPPVPVRRDVQDARVAVVHEHLRDFPTVEAPRESYGNFERISENPNDRVEPAERRS